MGNDCTVLQRQGRLKTCLLLSYASYDFCRRSFARLAPLSEAGSGPIRELSQGKRPRHDHHPAHNNGVDWGLLFYLSTALYLHDETMVHTALDRYKTDIDEQIKPDGILSSEITRNNSTGDAGYWYTNFALMPLTICTELFRIHGIDLYDYVSPKGGGLHKAYDKIADLMENPASYPFGTLYKSKLPHSLDQTFYAGYFEILNTRWPNREISTVLAGRRPWDPDHSLPATTLAYGDLKVPDGSATPVAE